jgi:hypothetical protein
MQLPHLITKERSLSIFSLLSPYLCTNADASPGMLEKLYSGNLSKPLSV